MYGATAASQYLGIQVESSTPLERVVLLYDAAVRWVGTARDAMDRKDIPTRREAVSRAMAIVGELQQSLDMDRGGATAAELDRLYTWMTEQLTDAVIRQDARPLADVERHLVTLGDAWRTIASQPAEAVR